MITRRSACQATTVHLRSRGELVSGDADEAALFSQSISGGGPDLRGGAERVLAGPAGSTIRRIGLASVDGAREDSGIDLSEQTRSKGGNL